ncbi:MAG TPA: transcription antitermination factor NusB [Acidimicrobiales bacterium]|nr:transcription antitermination factor NusB [Acidimicrobiales bacterium]
MSKPPTARRVALDALDAIDPGGAYANVASRTALAAGRLSDRDRHFVTELVHGTTRMRRACDHVVDRFLERSVSDRVRNVLRMGAYQLVFLRTADHAAVSETVDVAPKPARGLVNAVLRKIASLPDDLEWPDLATELSYPTWIVERLTVDLGADRAEAAMRTMNQAPSATERDDGYTQDLASQWVAQLVEAGPAERVLDLCAAPGGKATAMAVGAGTVIAADRREHRVATIVENVDRLGLTVPAVVADGAAPPFPDGAFDRVLVDAPCSGLGVLRRRPDARWRVTPADVDELAAVQRRLVDAAARVVRPGGVLIYSVCTLTDAETVDLDLLPSWEVLPVPDDAWGAHGRGARLLPQAAGTDGMFIQRMRRP